MPTSANTASDQKSQFNHAVLLTVIDLITQAYQVNSDRLALFNKNMNYIQKYIKDTNVQNVKNIESYKTINSLKEVCNFIKNLPEDLTEKEYIFFITFLTDQESFSDIIKNTDDFIEIIKNIPEDKQQIIFSILRTCLPNEIFISYDIDLEVNRAFDQKNKTFFHFF